MQLNLSDTAYTERLASFLESVGQPAHVDAPGQLHLERDVAETELVIYLRVWHVLYPDAVVDFQRCA
ncbi:MAG: hypothetical protein ACRDN6_00790 [Gaiellaceae bacterium]